MKDRLGSDKKAIVDLIATYLRGKESRGCLDRSWGNIPTVGHPVKQQPWRIGSKTSWKRGQHLLVLSVKDKSVVTSGIYERHLEVDGQSFHIFDSDWPQRQILSPLYLIDPADGR